MKAGINVWTWGFETKPQFEQAVREVGDLGYQAIENISRIAATYEDSVEEFQTLVTSHGLEFVCGYHHFSGNYEDDYARAERYLEFMQRTGAQIMNLQAGARPTGGPTPDDLSETARQATRICEAAQRRDVTVCLHPHYGTMVERADELAYMMEQVDPGLMSLTLDTAHTVLGGMDPVAAFSQYADRVRYVHMKDILPVEDPSQPWWSGFRELGRGIVNFPRIVAILQKVGFDGVLCVELDRPRVSMYKSAAISRQYLHDELGL
jgi:inosose dehydratase